MSLFIQFMQSPVGELSLVADENALTMVSFGHKDILGALNVETPLLKQAKTELAEYFSGFRTHFDIPLNPQGTAFQQKVWVALRHIPYGETRSYGEIASAVNNIKACRAVGMANNRNPIAIIIPCHRVIGADGALTGYAAGLKIKQQLLALESENKS